MSKNKLQKFAEMKTFQRVFEPEMEEFLETRYPLKGKWSESVFENKQPIVLELGCGKGEYAVGLGKKYPNKNFIGVDIKGARIWVGAKQAHQQQMPNVAFLRTSIDFVDKFFAPNEIDEIWLTFSDPQPKKPNKRLSSRVFIERYMRFLKPGGIIHLKTDNTLLYSFTLEQVQEHGYELLLKSSHILGEDWATFDTDLQEILSIKTHYEQLFTGKGFNVKYLSFVPK